MGLLGIDSTKTSSTSTDSRTAGTDQAVVAHQGAVGEHPLNVTGGTNAAAYQYNTDQQGALFLGSGAGNNRTVTLENVDADVIGKFGATLRDVLEAQGQAQSDSTQGIAQIQSGLFDSLSEKIAALSESQQTGGDSDRNKIILYVVLAVLAVVGIIFWRRK